MPSLRGCTHSHNWPFVGLIAFTCAVWPPAGSLPAEDLKATPALPNPVVKVDEDRVFRSLAKPTTVEFLDLPLEDCLTFLKEYHNLALRVDAAALARAKIPIDSPVTLKLNGDTFQRTLNLLLEPRGLDAYVDGPGLVVTIRAETADAVGNRLEKFLEYELQIIDHLCQLTDVQKRKLQLAGRGDIRRLSEGITERAQKLKLAGNDEKKVDEICREIEQLQGSIQSGPFGKGSLFRKGLETTLTAGQMVKYEPIREVIQAGGQVGTLERNQEIILGMLLIGKEISDKHLAQLKGLPILGSLILIQTPVTDAGLVHLEGLKNLKELTLGGTQVTDAGVAELRRALPALKIVR
jgi:hypothetical protein